MNLLTVVLSAETGLADTGRFSTFFKTEHPHRISENLISPRNFHSLFALIPVADPTPYDLTVLQGLYDIVDLFDPELFADQFVQHQISFHGHISKPWDVQMSVDVAVQDTYYRFTVRGEKCERQWCH